jgi:hypothetical protein
MDPVNPSDPATASVPPADAEEWTDEQWLDWLKATDADEPAKEVGAPPVTPMGRIHDTTGGKLLGQAMAGMAYAIFGRKDDEIVIVAEGDSEPDGDQPFTVHLDPDHPERSFVAFPHGSERPT